MPHGMTELDADRGYVTEIEYTASFFSELAPQHLRTAAWMKGASAPDPSKPFTYCEIGFGQGVTLVANAAAHPHARFYGVDLNPNHVLQARSLAKAAGVENLELFEGGIGTFVRGDSIPASDFVVLHGVWSWVSDRVQSDIVAFLQAKLKTGGLVYVSYNALPGWSEAVPLRWLVRAVADRAAGPIVDRFVAGRDFAERLDAANARYFATHPLAKSRLERMRTDDVRYLIHEYMNEAWMPYHHADVAAALAPASLGFVGSATLVENHLPYCLGEEAAKLVEEIGDPRLRETARDYLANQIFRRDLFARGSIKSDLAKEAARMRFALARPRGECTVEVSVPAGTLRLGSSVNQPVLDALAAGPTTPDGLAMRIDGVPSARIAEALPTLSAIRYVQPALDEDGEEVRARSTARFNSYGLSQPEQTAPRALMSPVTGCGVTVDAFARHFLKREAEGETLDAGPIADRIVNGGRALTVDGRSIEKPNEIRRAIEEKLDRYLAETRPWLQSLRIV